MAGQYARVYEFLDLPPLAAEKEARYSLEFEASSTSEPMDPVLQKKLRKFFAADIRKLEALLGEPTGWLEKSPA